MGVFIPDGLTLIKDLPNETANQLLLDWAYETGPNGKMWIQTIFDRALAGEHDDAVRAILDCATCAGESDYAIETWLEGK